MKQKKILIKALEDIVPGHSSSALQLFSFYYQELITWNKKFNLISSKDESRIVTRHFLESLGFLKAVDFASGANVLDLGTGAGFPGIPLAIVRPDLDLLLIEAKRKKAAFLRHICSELHLNRIKIIDRRIEKIDDQIQPQDIIVCRSVASLLKIYKWSHNCLKPFKGKLVTIKGDDYKKELDILLKQTGSDFGIEYTAKPYDPFPDLYSIRKCYVIIIRKKFITKYLINKFL